jgi:hypothetical protein
MRWAMKEGGVVGKQRALFALFSPPASGERLPLHLFFRSTS